MKFLKIVSLFFPALFLFFVFQPAEAQENKINWMSIEEAEARVKEEPKKIFVDIYTDWCSWCKRMESETFGHPVIAEYLNEHFYPVKLNAEQKEPIVFRGVEYVNENPGGRRSAHNFAAAILQGRMGYPSVAFFDKELNLVYALSGFRPPKSMKPVLVFFHEEIYKEDPDLDSFIENFEGEID